MKLRISFAFLTLMLPSSARADNWPQWRGPDNDGNCKETGLPTEWSDTKNIAWKLPTTTGRSRTVQAASRSRG